jgi:hypothetical protein
MLTARLPRVQTATQFRTPSFGAKVTSESRFSDFRPIAGVLFPFSQKEVEIATGRVLNEMHWSSIEVNPPIDSTAFSPPAHSVQSR